ncbi:MAG: ABC transporter substrate-binding protein [Candidatus Tectomicrobia bacterium]|nr:ABC transporter substrate-binding protein [Candidatus Tectomicrobia bacterium]
MSPELIKIKAFPTGMRLHEYVALEEGMYRDEGLDVEIMWEVLRGQMARWKNAYKERPQDIPFTTGEVSIGSACMWGTISNAGAGMGKFVPEVHGVSPWGIYVRPDSRIAAPEDLKDVPIAVGLRAGSHFNVPYHLERYLPLERIKPVNVGGFGARLKALVDGEFEAASLLPPQLDMAEQLGMRQVLGGEFKTLWWVDERVPVQTLRRYFRALTRAEEAISAEPRRYLHLWKHSNPPEFQDHPWDYNRFSRGERFVPEPLSRQEFEAIMEMVRRWGLDDYLKERSFDKIALSIA